MAEFVEVGIGGPEPGTGTAVKVGDRYVAVFNVGGTLYATDDTCPHAGSSLGNGKLDGPIVTCRSHGMRLDVTNGCVAGTSLPAIASYPVKVVDGKVLVAIASTDG